MMGGTRLCSLAITLVWLSGCANSGDFTNAHTFELQKDCTETLRCKSGSIEFASANDMQNCVTQSGKKLQNAGDDRQNLFLETVSRCEQLQVCDYLSCTQSDPASGYAAAHADLINWDCMQQTACKIAMGQQQSANAVSECVGVSASNLNVGTPQVQMGLEQKGVHCAGQQGCNWVNCK